MPLNCVGWASLIAGAEALRHVGFRQLWRAQIASQLGDAAFLLVFLFIADRITGDARLVALIGVLQTVPFLLLSPLAGVAADRVDRRKLMIASDVAGAIGLMPIFVATWIVGEPPYWLLGVTAAALSAANAFFYPSRDAAIPQLVPKEDVSSAIGVAVTTQQALYVVGLMLAAVALSVAERFAPNAFFLVAIAMNAVSFAVSAGLLTLLPRLRADRVDSVTKPWSEFKEGWTAIRSDPALRVHLPASLVISLATSGFLVAYAAANRLWFDGEFMTLAVLEVGFALPVAIVSLLVGRMAIRRPGLAFGWSATSVGLAVAAMALGDVFWLFFVLNVVAGIAWPFSIVPMQTYRMTQVSNEKLGRVNATFGMATLGVQPLGIALIGVLVDALGLAGAFLAMGVGMTLPALWAWSRREFREATV